MVELIYPQTSSTIYTEIDGYLWGPYFPQGLSSTDRITIPEDDLGQLVEHRGIFGENDVDHQKVDGTITYHPAHTSLWPNPYGQWPEQVRGRLFHGSSIWETDFEYGVAIDGKCSLTGAWYYQGDRHLWSTCRYCDNEWHAYFLHVWRRTDFSVPKYIVTQWTHYRYSNFRPPTSSGSPIILYDRHAEVVDTSTTVDNVWWNSTTHDMIVSFPSLVGKVPSRKPTAFDRTAPVFTYKGDWESPKRLKGLILTEVRKLSFDKFPLNEISYGELSYEAAKKVRASNVNMLEFLLDIRRPWELIPKLRNLRSLKGIASNYLTVDFGLLPTIDDLNRIVDAVMRRKPYLDKNGYATYTSYSDQSVAQNDLSYRLVQRAKLAVADDLDQLLAFSRRLDDFGFYPRFNDMWDLIPFSFVIDWFVDIGEFLDRIDTRLQIARLPIRYTTLSYRKSASTKLDNAFSPLVGTLSLVHYHRWVTDHCPAPPLTLQGSSDPLSHIIDGGALIIQRRK